MVCQTESRAAARRDLSWPVSMWHPSASRFFNGRSLNVSRTGALIQVPLLAPVRVGQLVELNFPRTPTLAAEAGGFARTKISRVVRVERDRLLQEGKLRVAVQFAAEPD